MGGDMPQHVPWGETEERIIQVKDTVGEVQCLEEAQRFIRTRTHFLEIARHKGPG